MCQTDSSSVWRSDFTDLAISMTSFSGKQIIVFSSVLESLENPEEALPVLPGTLIIAFV